jgi:hypothetical protein
MKTCFKTYLLFVIVLINSASVGNVVQTSEPDYATIFGSNWYNAEKFISENTNWMQNQAKYSKVDYFIARSIVFPELVRYSAVYDKMEITLLKALYVNYGTDYANFSVGVFQIKPSCAEQILQEVSLMHDKKFAAHFSPLNTALSVPDMREALIKDLENPETEFYYVLAMIKVLDKKYPNLNLNGDQNKLSFYATAYNCGFTNTEKYIRQRMNIKSFHPGLIKTEIQYSYADIAVSYYSNSSNFKASTALTFTK